ncbi:hypothetical protein BS78_04G090500 [Paspalum vaginatum]|nr:hypothetical protein BS78_04G090500 [Paspalum vaginatum]
MLGAGAVGAAWSAARGWLTPAVLFVAVNLVVATIAVASRLMAPGDGGGDEAAGERLGRGLLRAPSLAVDRLRSSLSFSRPGLLAGAGAGDDAQAQPLVLGAAGASAPEPAAEAEREEARIGRSRSEAAAEVAHAANKRRRPRARRAVAEEPAAVEVDARADDFIRRFREQLRLQRLDSILRYRDTLRRTGSAPPE